MSRGVADPTRIGVGGHSYGAFMAANLLAHCGDLFACGIARSGAYNRSARAGPDAVLCPVFPICGLERSFSCDAFMSASGSPLPLNIRLEPAISSRSSCMMLDMLRFERIALCARRVAAVTAAWHRP